MHADPELMRRALRLAERGWGSVQPNPMVGALVVRDGLVIAEGWHERYGEPHAEVHALRAAAERARDATLYVTLEPCNHHGKTPPCTDAILAAGVSRVIIGASDTHARAAGGAARLKEHGIEVIEGILADEVRTQNAAFFHWHEHGTPFVALKLALTIDGAIGRRAAPRELITGVAARAEANRLRAGFDAVLVGAGTARSDDPLLTVRDHPVCVPPLRVVLDAHASLDPESQLARTAGDVPLLLFTGADAAPDRVAALRARGVEVEVVGHGEAGLDPAAVMAALGGRGMRSVFIEGGGSVARSWLAANLVHRLYLFIAPRALSGEAIRPLAPWPAGAPTDWRRVSATRWGEDTMLLLDRNTD